ncbi:hypothetical protein Ciccas_003548 [Cichlidogyrus casuarinus]|uniref:Uncharacterized protein n=1 Tax=Cichlidogyrus casuarinus TaxID=1844966 RepID=A0ABD2QET2_9PLAT
MEINGKFHPSVIYYRAITKNIVLILLCFSVQKILVDCDILNKYFSMNSVDIELSKHLGKTHNKTKAVTISEFHDFVDQFLIPAYARDTRKSLEDADAFIKEALAKSLGPMLHGGTRFSVDSATVRMTDVAKYTGAHRERFDTETGRGRGKSGREDELRTDGFVSGYKLKDTHDQSHSSNN